MLSVASRYLGRVDASDSKREYLCSIVGFMPLVIWGSDRNLSGCRYDVATRDKTTFLCSRTFALFTLRTLLKAIICCLQLNTQWLLERHTEGGLLVIDAVELWSMYFFRNAQSESHSDPHDIYMLSLFYQLLNYNLFTEHVVIYLMQRHH
jgi:hypothetical protein